MAALTSSAGPFFAKDSNGTMQKIKVFDLKSQITASEDLIAGYAYIEATGSTLDSITGSLEKLIDISSSLANLDLTPLQSIEASMDYLTGSYERLSDISSTLQPLNGLEQAISQVTHSVDNNTKYVEQLLMFNRATNVYTRIYKKEDLFNSLNNTAISHSLHEDSFLNPYYGMEGGEEYMSKAVDVVIQNSTNKDLFLRIDYDPGAEISTGTYTVKLLPGIIYNSESKLAHIRHKMIFSNQASASFVGEVPVSIVYNGGLNNDLSIGETTPGQNLLSSIATNYYDMEFGQVVGGQPKKFVVAEWTYDINLFEGMVIRGQARVSDLNQIITLYITNDPLRNTILKSTTINDTAPEEFDLALIGSSAPTTSGRFELIAELGGTGNIGDARVLFADLIRYAKP